MRKRFPILTVILTLLTIVSTVNSSYAIELQNDTTLVQITLNSGTQYIGTISSEDETSVSIDLRDGGQLTVQRDQILSIEPYLSGWKENEYKTRYFFAPNAFALGQKKGYYQNTWIFFNNVNYGITDNFSLGGGIVPFFLLGSSFTPIWLLPKYSFNVPSDKWHFAIGGMIGGVVGTGELEFGSLLYGNTTYGDANSNISVGLGFGLTNDGIDSTPVLNINGIRRVSERWFLLAESYFIINEGEGFLIAGSRYVMQSISIDFGLLRPTGIEYGSFIGVPWVGIGIPFDRN